MKNVFKGVSVLCSQIEAVLTADSENTDLEEGATLIALWMQPHETFTLGDIKVQLDALTEEVKAQLLLTCPSHPLFAEDIATACLSPGDKKSLWSPANCKAVLAAIEQFIRTKFNQSFSHYTHPHKSYINIVLRERQAIPITLSIVMMGISRRLGVVLEPVSFPETFVLRWLEFPFKSGLDRYTYVDAFKGQFSLTSSQLSGRFAERAVDNQVDPRIVATMKECSKKEVRYLIFLSLSLTCLFFLCDLLA